MDTTAQQQPAATATKGGHTANMLNVHNSRWKPDRVYFTTYFCLPNNRNNNCNRTEKRV